MNLDTVVQICWVFLLKHAIKWLPGSLTGSIKEEFSPLFVLFLFNQSLKDVILHLLEGIQYLYQLQPWNQKNFGIRHKKQPQMNLILSVLDSSKVGPIEHFFSQQLKHLDNIFFNKEVKTIMCACNLKINLRITLQMQSRFEKEIWSQ